MKKSLFFVGIALLGAPCFAAPVRAQNAALPLSTQAEAMALLDKSAAAYAALEGLSMRTAYYVDGLGEILRGTTTFAFEKSGRARVTLSVMPEAQIIAVAAKNAASAKAEIARAVEYGAPGAQLPLKSLVQGKNPLRQGSMTVMDEKYVWGKTARLLPDHGVAATFAAPADSDFPPTVEMAMYFDPNDHLLRRVDVKGQYEGERFFSSTVMSEVQINPQFAPDTFVEPKRIKPKRINWDPKLEVGSEPYALQGADLAKYRGKVVLLDFWATWCGPCVAELPNVQSNYEKYHARGFEVIGISLDEDKAALMGFVKARKMPWPQLFDGKGWKTPNAVRYGVRGIPFTLLIGKDGKIAAVDAGGSDLEPAIKKALAK